MLHKNIEEAMDSSEIVFLPAIGKEKAIDWKLMVVDQSKLKDSITERHKWGVRIDFYYNYSNLANIRRIYMANACSF